MTEVSEGEHEVNNKNIAGDSDDIKIDPNENENDSTFDGVNGEEEDDNPPKSPSSPEESELMAFLTKHDLTDIHLQILSSKLKLSHLVKADKSDLDDLCNDLQLDSSQKIRLKHAIKASQSKRRRINIQHK